MTVERSSPERPVRSLMALPGHAKHPSSTGAAGTGPVARSPPTDGATGRASAAAACRLDLGLRQDQLPEFAPNRSELIGCRVR
jgi:hypothetical protein